MNKPIIEEITDVEWLVEEESWDDSDPLFLGTMIVTTPSGRYCGRFDYVRSYHNIEFDSAVKENRIAAVKDYFEMYDHVDVDWIKIG